MLRLLPANLQDLLQEPCTTDAFISVVHKGTLRKRMDLFTARQLCGSGHMASQTAAGLQLVDLVVGVR